MQTELRAWTVKDSIELYNVNGWGRDFFTINDAGNIAVTPAGPGSPPIDLRDLVDDLRSGRRDGDIPAHGTLARVRQHIPAERAVGPAALDDRGAPAWLPAKEVGG